MVFASISNDHAFNFSDMITITYGCFAYQMRMEGKTAHFSHSLSHKTLMILYDTGRIPRCVVHRDHLISHAAKIKIQQA